MEYDYTSEQSSQRYEYTLEGLLRDPTGRQVLITTEGSRLNGMTTEATVILQAYHMGLNNYVWYFNGIAQGFDACGQLDS